MKTKKAGVGNLGEEELAQVRAKKITRAETRAEAEALFDGVNAAAAREQRKVKGLFVQTEGAETMAPILTKSASVTAATDEFFEKLAAENLTEAQRRYPELQKVAAAPGGRGTFAVPALKRPSSATSGTNTGATAPATSSLSGRAS